jgi:hypothetical protein
MQLVGVLTGLLQGHTGLGAPQVMVGQGRSQVRILEKRDPTGRLKFVECRPIGCDVPDLASLVDGSEKTRVKRLGGRSKPSRTYSP